MQKDVMQAAREACAQEYEKDGMATMTKGFKLGHFDDSAATLSAARAIAAERERCAALADRYALQASSTEGEIAGVRLAAEIRGGFV